jgi:hypothetical protein
MMLRPRCCSRWGSQRPRGRGAGSLGVTFGSLWGNFVITLGSLWGNFGRHFGITLGTLWLVASRPPGQVPLLEAAWHLSAKRLWRALIPVVFGSLSSSSGSVAMGRSFTGCELGSSFAGGGSPGLALAASSAFAVRLLAFFLATAASVRRGLPRPGGSARGTSSPSDCCPLALLMPEQRDSVVPPVQLRGSSSSCWAPCEGTLAGRAGLPGSPRGSRPPSGGQLRSRANLGEGRALSSDKH